MNKVFKVIWSEARNAYVVVSEMAKSHGTKSCSTKKLLAMLIATGVMTCASMAPAMAANPAPDDKNIAIGSGASTNTYNYNNVYGDKPITGDIAIGQKAYAWNGGYNEGQDIYIGTHEYYMDFGQGGIVLDHWLGKPYYKVVDGSKVAGSIAIGKNSVARTGSTILGDHTYNGKIGDTEITSKTNYMNIQPAVFSTTIGSNTYNAGTLATVTGAFSIASSQFNGSGNTNTKNYGAQNTGATIYGSMNSIESATSNDRATRGYSGIASSVLGFANRTQNANAALIWGTGNEITNSIEAVTGVDFTKWNSMSVSDAQKDAIKAMQSNQYAGGSVMAIGGGNKADYTTYSELTGVQNKVTGTKAKAAKYDLVNGYQNTVYEASDVTVIGIKNEVKADGNKVIGDNHKVSGKDNVIFGSADQLTETTVNNAVVLGHNAKVTGEGGVALGAGSVADRANAVSVGSTGANRQIINVAAGEADTDAVNVSQLQKVSDTANAGWNLSTNGFATEATNVKPGGYVDFSGDDENITVSKEENEYATLVKVNLNRDLNVDSVHAGDFFMNNDMGIGFGGSAYITKNGLNANDKVITNVAAGVYNTDAVNVGQLKKVEEVAANANKGWNLATNGFGTEATNVKPGDYVDFSGDKNISVSHDGTKVQVKLNENIDVNSIKTNALNSKYNLSVGTMAENGIMPFLVNSTGAFYAANNNFSVDKDGKVIATAGEIGNVVLNNGVVYKNSALRDGELYVGDADGNYSQITPKSAKLGQVTIDEKGNMAGVNSIKTNALNSKYNLSVGTMAENGIMPFLVNSTGAFYAANNNFSVDKDGKVIATAGEIGNVVLNNGVVYKNSALRDGELYVGDADGNYSQITPKSAKLGQVTIDEKGNMAGVNSIKTNALNAKYNLSVGTMAENGIMPFLVNSTGAFYAANNNFSVDKDGKVIATAGEIGNVVLNNGVVYKNSALRDGELYVGDASGNYSQITTTGAKLGQVTIAADGKISGVAAGEADTDAVNVSQLKKVEEVAANANKGWNLSTNGVATEATNVKPGDYVDFSGDKNISVSHEGTKVQVELNENIDVNSIKTNALNSKYNLSVGTMAENGIMPFLVNSTGAFYAANNNFSVDKDGKVIATAGEIGNVVLNNGVVYKNSALRDGELYVGDADGNYSQITPKSAKLGQVTIDEKGNMAGVNSIKTNALNAKYNLSVGTMAENGIMPFLVNSTGAFYAANNNFSVDKDGKVIATAGEIGNVVLNNGVVYKNSALRDGELYVGDASGNYSQITTTGAKLGQVTIAADGKISGVAAGEADTDAVNVSQLNAVATEAGKHTTLSNGKNTTVESTVKDGQTDYKVNVAGDLTDITSVANGDSKINLNKDSIIISNGNKYFAITNSGIGMSYIGADYSAKSIMLGENGTTISGGLNVAGSKITGVAAGEVSKTSTDAINGSQLHAVATEAGKHTTLSNGKNTTVESTVKDGQTDYKVNVAGDLTDITSVANGDSKINLNKDSIIISNGNKYFAITNSGIGMSYIGADYSAKSIMLGENGTTISGGLNVAGSKITNVKAGEADTDAVNVGQLKDYVAANDTHIKSGEYVVGEVTDSTGNKSQGVSMDIVNKEGNVTGTVTITDVAKASDVGNVNDIASDIKNQDGSHTTVVNAVNNLNNKVGDLNYVEGGKGNYVTNGENTTTSIGKLDQALKDVADTANQGWNLSTNGGEASKVAPGKTVDFSGDKNIKIRNDGTNVEVKLNEAIDVKTVTTGNTVMNSDGVKVGADVSLNQNGLNVGKDVSVTATAVTAGKTSISDEGVKVGDKTYISADGLNANGQHITNVKAGEADTDAVNYGQLKDTNNRIDGVENQVVNNTNRINKLGSRVNKVGAGAAALAALHPMDFDPDDKLTFSAGYGNYGGENAAAIGAYYRPDEKVMFSVAGTVGNGENMVNAGVSFALDRTNHVSNSRTALAREVIDLRGQLAVMGAKMAKMEKAFGMLDETKTKLFPDVPANHWAYEYIAKLAGNGYIEGYPDGNFGGDRLMTRYEFAAMLYRAIEKGAALEEKIIKEFEPELGRIRVDRISGEDGDRDKIERVRVNDTKGERDHYGNKLAK